MDEELEDRNKRIYKLRSQGFSLGEIASLFGISRSRVSRIVTETEERYHLPKARLVYARSVARHSTLGKNSIQD